MLHTLTEQQEMMRKTFRDFVTAEVWPKVRDMEEHNEYPRALMKRCAELNLTGILFPEKYGGLGLGLTEFCLRSRKSRELPRPWRLLWMRASHCASSPS